MLRRTFFATLAVLALAASANAGTVYTWLVIDPPTTAGAGGAALPSAGQNLAVSSSRSGAGSYHLYAVDDADGSAGLRSFFVKLNPGAGGTLGASNNRSPLGNFDTEATYGDGVPSNIGFDTARNAAPLFTGTQGPGNSVQIDGIGITAGSFAGEAPTIGSWQSAPTSGQWGNYAAGDGPTSGVVTATGHVRNAIFLGEGLYTVAPPTIDLTTTFDANGTGFNLWVAQGFPNSGSTTVAVGSTGNTLANVNPFGAVIPEPATVTLIGLALVGFSGLVRRRR